MSLTQVDEQRYTICCKYFIIPDQLKWELSFKTARKIWSSLNQYAPIESGNKASPLNMCTVYCFFCECTIKWISKRVGKCTCQAEMLQILHRFWIVDVWSPFTLILLACFMPICQQTKDGYSFIFHIPTVSAKLPKCAKPCSLRVFVFFKLQLPF